MEKEINVFKANLLKSIFYWIIPVCLLVFVVLKDQNDNSSFLFFIVFLVVIRKIIIFQNHFSLFRKTEIRFEGNNVQISSHNRLIETFDLTEVKKVIEFSFSRTGLIKWEIILNDNRKIYMSNLVIFKIFFKQYFYGKIDEKPSLFPYIK